MYHDAIWSSLLNFYSFTANYLLLVSELSQWIITRIRTNTRATILSGNSDPRQKKYFSMIHHVMRGLLHAIHYRHYSHQLYFLDFPTKINIYCLSHKNHIVVLQRIQKGREKKQTISHLPSRAVEETI